MEFEWDEAKIDVYLARRGFDFAFAAGVLAGPTLPVEVDDRRNHGEPRLVAVGRIEDAAGREGADHLGPSASRKEIARYGIGQRRSDAGRPAVGIGPHP